MAFEDKPYDLINQGNRFSKREVGLTHPDKPAHLKMLDNGDIHLMVNESLGIIMSSAQNAIILVADNVKFLTKEDEGLRWNKLAFNPKAVKFNEPAFIYPKNQTAGIYDGVSDFLES